MSTGDSAGYQRFRILFQERHVPVIVTGAQLGSRGRGKILGISAGVKLRSNLEALLNRISDFDER